MKENYVSRSVISVQKGRGQRVVNKTREYKGGDIKEEDGMGREGGRG